MHCCDLQSMLLTGYGVTPLRSVSLLHHCKHHVTHLALGGPFSMRCRGTCKRHVGGSKSRC